MLGSKDHNPIDREMADPVWWRGEPNHWEANGHNHDHTPTQEAVDEPKSMPPAFLWNRRDGIF